MTAYTTRFAPSPTGHLHVGGARTALFSYLIARQSGGTFILRIEDTDRSRHVESAVEMILQDLRWLGIDWDEGPQVGGPNGPYQQSERLEIYQEHIQKLLDEGKAYYAFETAEELQTMRARAEASKQNFRYQRPDPLPTEADAAQAAAEGRPVTVRFLVPGQAVTVRDDAFGEVTVPAEEMEDFVIRKADGFPTFYLANVVDDALMGVNYILRGQEFLGQTWRQVLLRQALRFDEPRYCHLPLIMDMEGRKLSKRDGAVEVHSFRRAGYLPEALRNFLALLGWNPGSEQEQMTLELLIELFSVDRIGKANAKFDRDKLLSFNTDWIARAGEDRLLDAFKDWLTLNDSPIPREDDDLLRRVLRATRGVRTLADIEGKAGRLFMDDDAIEYDAKGLKVLGKNDNQGFDVLAEIRPRLAELDWTEQAIENCIRQFCEEKGLGMGKVAQPLRVALTGTTVSPGIAETLLFAGKAKTIRRITRTLELR